MRDALVFQRIASKTRLTLAIIRICAYLYLKLDLVIGIQRQYCTVQFDLGSHGDISMHTSTPTRHEIALTVISH